jgi:HSP20 family protein
MSSRWDQFDNQFTSLRDAMGRLLDQSFTFGNRGEGAEATAQSVPVNVFESEDVLMIIAPMPGLEEEDIEIAVRGNSLTVEGNERADLKPESGKRYLRHEWRYGPYRRTLELPYAVDANSAEATLGNGVLTVRLQKAATERSHRIQVKSGAETGSRTIRPTEQVQHQTPGQSEQI